MKIAGIEFEVEVDASGVAFARTKAQEDLQKLQAEFEKLNGKSKKSGEAMQNMGKKAGAAGIQIQQLVGQIQGGQNVFNALSAQAADLGIVLGAPLVGAVAGLGAAFAGILLPSLFDTEDKTQSLIDKLKELSKTQVLSSEEARVLARAEAEKAGETYASIKASEKKIKTDKEDLKTQERWLKSYGRSNWERSRTSKKIGELIRSIEQEEARLKGLNREYDKAKETQALYNSMVKGTTNQTGEQKEAVESLVLALESQANAIGKTNRELAIQEAAQKGATQEQIDAINTAFNSIEAEEKRKEAIVQARKDAMIAARMEHEDYKAMMAERDALEKERLRKQFEEQQTKDESQSNVDRIRESLMSEQQLRAEAFTTELEQLKAARDLKLITQDEFNQLEKDKAQQHASELIAIEKDRVNKELQLEQQKRQAKLALVGDIFGNLASLMNAGSKKLFAIGKASAVAGAIVDGYAAVSKTMASVPYPLNVPLAAAQAVASAAQVKGIMSTQFGSAGTGQSFQGGQVVNNVAAQQQQQPQSQQRNISIALTGDNFSGAGIRGLIAAIDEELGDGVTLSATGA